MLHAAHVGEAQVDELHVFILDRFQDFVGGGHGGLSVMGNAKLSQGACQLSGLFISAGCDGSSIKLHIYGAAFALG
ncbi:MAG: hypothetical protein ACREP1_08930 [Rhodanobacteraceae bacterium]